MKNMMIIERFHENEELAEKFHLLDTRILAILNDRDFSQVLLEQIADFFAVPSVGLSLIADDRLYQKKQQRGTHG